MTTQHLWTEIELHPLLQRVMKEEFNFKYLMPVQKAAIPLFLKNYDVAVEAQTGSGKTLTFLIPMLNQLLKMHFKQHLITLPTNSLFGLIIAPSRELAQQIYEVAEKFLKYINIKLYLCIGGSTSNDIELLNTDGCNILIGTLGRLKQALEDPKLELKVRDLEFLIMDEADRLIQEEYKEDLRIIVGKLPKQRRTGLFSATLSSVRMNDLLKLGMRNPVQVKADADQIVPSTLMNSFIISENRTDKLAILIDIFLQRCVNTKTIVFFNTCASVEYYNLLLKQFSELGCITFHSMHGKMKQKKRVKIFNAFKQSQAQSQVLLTTDVLARGIDFEDVPLVVQFDPPQDPNFFIHRSGRTARSGRDGQSILLIESNERGFIQYLKRNNIEMKEITITKKTDFQSLKQQAHKVILNDRDLIEKGKAAFVSFIRSYKENKLQLLFNLNHLDIGQVAYSFFLIRLPRVKEILGKKIEFEQLNVNPNEVEFQDKNKAKQFNSKKEQKETKLQEKQKELSEIKKVSFHKQYMGKEINVKNNKSLRKKVKQANLEEDQDELIEEQRLVKRLKSGKISLKQFNEEMRQLDPDDLQDVDFDGKIN